MMRVILLAFDGAQGLDVFGPAEVFAGVGRHTGAPGYEVIVVSPGGGSIRATSGVALGTKGIGRVRLRADDTLLAVGGTDEGLRRVASSVALTRWLKRASTKVRRIGSVCSGAFLLAQAGILDGRRVATHWSACEKLAAFRPQLTVDPNAIFVQEGKIWTSAGVTTGIDMALAMVEEDHGRRAADTIAARLVLHARRPGFQSQFSETLVAQTSTSDPLGPAVAWARANVRSGVDVPGLARKAGLSVRTLHRRCAEDLGTTPAKLIERLRVEHARTLLTTTDLGTKGVASRSGFRSASRMARAFQRTLGVLPRDYRLVSAGA
jgi:transcriptional regulator GlxA family with amidase domain